MAAATTIGVYTLANLVIKFSLVDLLEEAFSTRSRIFDAVDSPNSFVTLARTTPERLTQPERMSSPAVIPRGTLSPVSATVSRLELPSSTVPSIGTFSPGFTTIVSPTLTSSGDTQTTVPSLSTFAVSGLMSISDEIESLLLPSAISSKNSPTWKNSMTKTASGNWLSAPGMKPMAKAPRVAILIRKSSSRSSPWSSFSVASMRVSPPAIRYGTRNRRSSCHNFRFTVLLINIAATSSTVLATIFTSLSLFSFSIFLLLFYS